MPHPVTDERGIPRQSRCGVRHQTRRSCSPSASPWPPSCGSAGRSVTYAPTLS